MTSADDAPPLPSTPVIKGADYPPLTVSPNGTVMTGGGLATTQRGDSESELAAEKLMSPKGRARDLSRPVKREAGDQAVIEEIFENERLQVSRVICRNSLYLLSIAVSAASMLGKASSFMVNPRSRFEVGDIRGRATSFQPTVWPTGQ